MKPVIAERAKAQQARTEENRVCQISDEQAIDTKKELAKVAGVSHDTIAKVETIEHKAPEPVIMASRKGDISVNSAPYKKAADCKSQPLFLSVSKQNSDGKSAIEEI